MTLPMPARQPDGPFPPTRPRLARLRPRPARLRPRPARLRPRLARLRLRLARLRPALAGALLTGLCAGLLTAGCSSPAGRPSTASRPGARKLSAGTSPRTSTHPAPRIMPSTTPAARTPKPRHHPARASSPAPAPAPTATAVPGPSPTGVVTPAPLAQCSSAALRISLGGAGGAAGSIYYPLEFTNISASACTLYGYPGVSFVSAPDGAELGGAAVRNSSVGPALVTLAPGGMAHASVQVAVAQNYPPSMCKPVTAHWLRVYPPGQYVPLYTGLTAMTCTGKIPGGSTLGIYVVRPGATGP